MGTFKTQKATQRREKVTSFGTEFVQKSHKVLNQRIIYGTTKVQIIK